MSAATSEPSDGSPAGKVYREMVKDLLAAEYDRRAKMEARGSTIVTASTSMLTLVFGLTVIVTGNDFVFANGFAAFVLLVALGAFVFSAVLGIVAQHYSFAYWTVSPESLQQLTGSTFWSRPADHALRDDISQQVTTISTLRTANQRTARLVMASLGFQIAAVFLLALSLEVEMVSRWH